jgi:hypothetical protein
MNCQFIVVATINFLADTCSLVWIAFKQLGDGGFRIFHNPLLSGYFSEESRNLLRISMMLRLFPGTI